MRISRNLVDKLDFEGKKEKLKIGWCFNCNLTVVTIKDRIETCTNCNTVVKKLTSDLRPVFARERKLMEFFGIDCIDKTVWKSIKAKQYFVDGNSLEIPNMSVIREKIDDIRNYITKYSEEDFENMDSKIMSDYKRTLKYCDDYLKSIEEIAFEFIEEKLAKHHNKTAVVSFSGGKDSTVVSDLVIRKMGSSKIPHIFSDTTLEEEYTYDYIQSFRQENPLIPFFIAKTNHDFYELVDEIGPPSRVMRWCCSVFKTTPIDDIYKKMEDSLGKILAFYGVRKAESQQRSKYDADTDGAKMVNQTTVSPIMDWLEFDIWLYILMNELNFNKAYKLGFTRVGCWLCPMNSFWSDILVELFYPERFNKWNEKLIDFAKKIGKSDPEVYVFDKKWTNRFGGAGLDNRFTGLEIEACGEVKGMKRVNLNSEINDQFFEFLKPFGNLEIKNEALGEYYLIPKINGGNIELKIYIQVFKGSKDIRVSVMNALVAEKEKYQRYIKYQITKFQNCIYCTTCSSACPKGAIKVDPLQGKYYIDETMCNNCLKCVTYFDSNGCLIAKSIGSYGEG
ncbi:phosphoadenosine phosphosulfate reductase family protein [Natranaerofaba carboxydovora]|uniref:phosphoadenosine phosphosulfate reductase domain-containing protein n=1 Tax=Natranaerofaba carboxydovora TaxID=2742683 RepID=UPI001F137C3D|nr:phosphoadenosine phosphosulfate reductase family protein [Natranaerofaba carboxydovora]UMZ74366.1 Phosphoadenosine phosphosulfate reductase [Natranaerofaba carboxydovora]